MLILFVFFKLRLFSRPKQSPQRKKSIYGMAAVRAGQLASASG